ncbi:hypothetical protein B0H12DRAFT_1141719, partial [Mycena haematopus]
MTMIVLYNPSLGFLDIEEFRVHENDAFEMIGKDSSDNRSFPHIQLPYLAVSASSAGPEYRALRSIRA